MRLDDKAQLRAKLEVKFEGVVRNLGNKRVLDGLDLVLAIPHCGEVVVLHLDQNLGSMRKKLILKRNSWH
jgi:hypothetical protein